MVLRSAVHALIPPLTLSYLIGFALLVPWGPFFKDTKKDIDRDIYRARGRDRDKDRDRDRDGDREMHRGSG